MSQLVFISGKAALQAFINDRRDGAVDRLQSGGYNASKKLANSIRTEVHSGPGYDAATLSALSYWKWVGNGRGPGKAPPLSNIMQWIRAKGMASTDQTIYRLGLAIRTKIAKEGTLDYQLGGKNVFRQEVIENQNAINPVLRAYLKDISNPLHSQMGQAFAA